MQTTTRRVRNTAVFLLLVAGSTLASASQQTKPGGPLTYRPTVVVQLGVSNLDKAVSFYTEVLEFTLTEKRADLKFAHIQTNVPGLEIGLSEGSTISGTGAAVINIGVADVVAARTLLESRGVEFSGPTQVIPGKVALAGFTDQDGNRLRLAGPPPRGR
jgi:predicted enzyme related to lactoylglutathione lyase